MGSEQRCSVGAWCNPTPKPIPFRAAAPASCSSQQLCASSAERSRLAWSRL